MAGIKNLKLLFEQPHCASTQESKHDTAEGGAAGVRGGAKRENQINNLINPLGFCTIKAERDIFYGILTRYLRLSP